jgi:CRP-like cAMP-binding protein
MMSFDQISQVHPLFADVTEAEWVGAVGPGETEYVDFVSEEILQSFQPDTAKLGILLEGTAAAYTSDGKIVRKFQAPHLFGLSALFAESPSYPTEIIASSSGRVFWLAGSAVKRLLHLSPPFFDQYLRITSQKLIFLNDHIHLLLYESARERIEAFLVRCWQNHGNPCPIGYNRKEWAQYLGISRASLYRELDLLQQKGWILVEKKQITLTELYLQKRSLI